MLVRKAVSAELERNGFPRARRTRQPRNSSQGAQNLQTSATTLNTAGTSLLSALWLPGVKQSFRFCHPKKGPKEGAAPMPPPWLFVV
jgi:hypothetical protein